MFYKRRYEIFSVQPAKTPLMHKCEELQGRHHQDRPSSPGAGHREVPRHTGSCQSQAGMITSILSILLKLRLFFYGKNDNDF